MTHAYASLDQTPGRLPTCGDRCQRVQMVAPETRRLVSVWLHDAERHDSLCADCAQPKHAIVRVGALEIDANRTEARIDGTPVPLTPTEWDILAYLAQRPGRTVRQSELLVAVWGQAYRGEIRLLHVNLARLRTKIGDRRQDIIRTIPGIGYRFADSAPLWMPWPIRERPEGTERCRNGHVRTTENTKRRTDGCRECRECRRAWHRRRRGRFDALRGLP